MKQNEIKRIIESRIANPDYVFMNYEGMTLAFEEAETGITESEILQAFDKAAPGFKTPDTVALIAAFLPVACLDILDRTQSAWSALICQALCWISWIIVIGTIYDMIIGKTILTEGLLVVGFNAIIWSWSFRGWTKYWNTLELIYQVLSVRGKLPRT